MQHYNDLNHTGVPGMRWGHRKAESTSSIKRRFEETKTEKKSVNKEYSKSFNKYANNPLNAVTKKGNERWNKVLDLAEKANQADKNFKIAKTERKAAINTKTNEINKQTSVGEKLLFNNATRKLAAKYVVDHDMPLSEATKKSHAVAIRNTAAFMAVYGGIMVAVLKN